VPPPPALGRSLPLPLPPGPGGAPAAVSLTFDVDAECGWLAAGDAYRDRWTTLSEARFGVVRGVPRILELLAELGLPATFYVPGDTAERHTALVEPIVSAGHEIGHHGHLHLRAHQSDAAAQREEVERGFAALRDHLGVTPTGYRSPSWELTPTTFALLLEHGFAYDSSAMGDDRPYLEEHGGRSLLELPVHWSLDDWAYFAWSTDRGGSLADPGVLERAWLGEVESAIREGRHVTFTMHPEVIGRGYRSEALRRLLAALRERGVWFADHRGVVAHLRSAGVLDGRGP
jgi:peptidoglycan/xylan/chitin deacetylase (PgdA/CDA1 family)